MRVLIADADPQFSNAVRMALRSDALVVEVVADADAAVERATDTPYSVIVADLSLPGRSGIGLLSRLRRADVTAPILAVTTDPAASARIDALRQGADDCLAKPVLIAELVARVHALARRFGRRSGDCLELEDLVLHCAKRRAFRGGQALPLTGREFAALELLVRAHGQPVSATELRSRLWHEAAPPQENFISVLMMRVRKKVDSGQTTKLIHTLRGTGYAASALKP